jgi:arginyl-tRNA synthetase
MVRFGQVLDRNSKSSFVPKIPTLKEEKNVKISRLNLCDLTAKTLKLSLELLGIETLERM